MRALACLGVLLVGGCSGTTELVVVTDSDLVVPTDIDEVVFEITSPGGDRQTRRAMLSGPDARSLPLTAVLLHRQGALGPVEVRVIAQRDGREVLRRDVIAWFVLGRSVPVHVELTSACRGRSCPESATCVGGECVPLRFEPDAGMDAGAASRVDAGPPDTGPVCLPAGCECLQSCEGGCECGAGCACELTCPPGGDCTSGRCGVDATCRIAAQRASNLAHTCEHGALCVIDAERASNVDVVCESGARCEVDCSRVSNCHVECQRGAQCVVDCDHASNCDISGCGDRDDDERDRCDHDLLVCNTDCP